MPQRRALFRCRWRVALLLAVVPFTAHAAATVSLRGFHHTAWTIKDGAPVDIWAMLQDDNGELLLGTGAGLYRFDGVRFQRQASPAGERLPSSNITALRRQGDSLWLGYHAAGATLWQQGHGLRHFRAGRDFPRGMVFGFETDGDGRLWAAADQGLAHFDGAHWHTVGTDWGYPGPHADWLVRGRDGSLWVATGSTVVYLPPGTARFQPSGVATSRYAVMAEDARGRLWLSDTLHGTRVIAGNTAGAPAASLPVAAKRLLPMPDGSWWATDGVKGGLRRFAAAGVPAESFESEQGLTSDMAVPLLRDREGNLWVGTNLGLNRFRRNDVTCVDALQDTTHGNFAMFVGGDGAIRVLNDGRMFLGNRDGIRPVDGGVPNIVSALPDGSGGAWLHDRNVLLHMHADGSTTPAPPLPHGRTGTDISAMASDRVGGLWVVVSVDGVYRGGDGGWRREPIESESPPTVLASAGDDGVWLGYPDSTARLLRDGVWRQFDIGDGLDVGNVTAIAVDGDQVLVAGEDGVAQRDGDRFTSLSRDQSARFTGITGILHALDGHWWFNGSAGVLRVADAELAASFGNPGVMPALRLFDDQDGLVGVAIQSRPTPTLAMDREGVLWIATSQGIAWIDPARIQVNPLAPPVTIQQIATEHGEQVARPGLELDEGTTQIRIDYTAASLTVPERVRFRYRLEGADDAWQDAGARRQAFYTKLGPGPYRFQVMAANNDGVWNEEGAVLDFSIRPSFVQSRAFVVTCVLGMGVLLWLAHLLRVQRASARLRERLEERHNERERIARDLHDTLLQGFQGLLLRFQAVAERMPDSSDDRMRMDQALDSAEHALEEGRDRVGGLRGEGFPDHALDEALAAVGRDYATGERPRFEVVNIGTACAMQAVARDEVYLIGREAIVNAFRHARADVVRVTLRHDADALRLRIADDGCGVPVGVLTTGGRPGHWGLAGMRERASHVGAALRIGVDDDTGRGTAVQLELPASRAYRDDRPGWLQRLWRLWNEGL